MLNFSHHISTKDLCCRVQSYVLKSVAGSTWEKDKETKTTTYKKIIKCSVGLFKYHTIFVKRLNETEYIVKYIYS